MKPKYYKFCLWKAYFDKGYGLTTYPKWAMAIFGIASAIKGTKMSYILTGTLVYGILCFVVGYFWYKSGIVLAEAEVSNQFNFFQRELRKKLKIETFK